MKYRNQRNAFFWDLQMFAEGGEGADPESTGGDDGNENQDGDNGNDGAEDEKKYSAKDLEEAVKKQLAKEKRKWQREQQKNRDSGKKEDAGAAGGDAGDSDKDSDSRTSEAEKRANRLEVKVACFEADVAKDAVDDVAALAHAYMEADDTLDLEDAIEKVVKKYPHFKKGGADPYENDPDQGKAWGERQRRAQAKRQSGVEAAFLQKNPGLKIN